MLPRMDVPGIWIERIAVAVANVVRDVVAVVIVVHRPSGIIKVRGLELYFRFNFIF